VTEFLEKARWWSTLKVIVQFLHAKNVEQVRVEFGFLLGHDLEGKPPAQDQIVRLRELECFIKRSLDGGEIDVQPSVLV
jgi:hypothetical protein